LSLSGYIAGIHFASSIELITPSLPFKVIRNVLDPASVFIGWSCWIGAALLAIFPPHDFWRGAVVFAIVFAPVGCLLRFYLALYLNSRIPSFPLGTFVANILGTVILGVAWDIAHIPAGGFITCQVMQGLEDGLCGCLTTVSTWVSELSGLRKRNAYVYGATSVVTAFAFMVVVMGALRWSDGFDELKCTVP
jgi:fluoride ion exporter CrcB/FEX